MSEASGAGVIEPPMEQILLAGSNTSLYATGPVDPDPSPSGAFACSYADVPTVTNLSEARRHARPPRRGARWAPHFALFRSAACRLGRRLAGAAHRQRGGGAAVHDGQAVRQGGVLRLPIFLRARRRAAQAARRDAAGARATPHAVPRSAAPAEQQRAPVPQELRTNIASFVDSKRHAVQTHQHRGRTPPLAGGLSRTFATAAGTCCRSCCPRTRSRSARTRSRRR